MVLMLWGPDRYRQGSCSIWAQSFLQCDSFHPSLRSNSLDASFYLALFFKKTPNFPVFLETSMGQEDCPLPRTSQLACSPSCAAARMPHLRRRRHTWEVSSDLRGRPCPLEGSHVISSCISELSHVSSSAG